ncbi:hypothetical protein TSOC_009044 [Tetrabaena socialis]|uniref:Uncharacterized protein n=1 Tax=Tetrabaena socialis TaxID=47790 RepID=A0A2J7ZWT2_9CHLO|nr:hypothetical protein TSOC_009044 [Tetrabaena socialis]|eukprot:PNH04718.1 hypothetical protein TSOC_009044 [Tetrabaena socialis]
MPCSGASATAASPAAEGRLSGGSGEAGGSASAAAEARPAGSAPAPAEAQQEHDGARHGAPAVVAGGGGSGGDNGDGGASYAVNFGTAVRALRDDLPQLLARPPQWHIFRSDLVFLSPWAPPLRGLDRYRLLHRQGRGGQAAGRLALLYLRKLLAPQARQDLHDITCTTYLLTGRIIAGGPQSVIRILSRLLYRTASVELMRLWIPPSAGPGGDADYSSAAHDAGGGDGATPGAGASGSGSSSSSSGGSLGGGGQLRARWRATGQPWLPWSDQERLEVVATYRFDARGLIASHELTTVIPPEPPLLLWPLLAVVQAAGRMRQGEREAGGVGPGGRVRLPLPGAFDAGERR